MDAIVSIDTAVKMGGAKHGLASQAWRDLYLIDNRLRLVNNLMYVAMKSFKCCTGKA